MERVIFAVHTEYQLMYAIRVAYTLFKGSNFEKYILRISPLNSKRLSGDYSFKTTDLKYSEIFYKNGYFKGSEFRHAIDQKLIALKPDYYFVFNELHSYNRYILKNLYKYKTKIYWAPDGTNMYQKEILSLKERLSLFLWGTVFLMSNGFFLVNRIPGRYNAYTKEIKHVVVDKRRAFYNYYRKDVIEINNRDNNVNSIIKKVFQIDPSIINIKRQSFLWIDQPFPEDIEKQKEQFISELRKKFPQIPLYIKPHPSSRPEIIANYIKKYRAILVDIPYPCELIIQNIKEVCTISVHSTAQLFHNPMCLYYWIYPRFGGQDLFYGEIPHIKIITDVDEIVL